MKFVVFAMAMLSGCASTGFKPAVDSSSVSIGMSGSEFRQKYGALGKKIQYTESDSGSYAWVLESGKERIWLNGNIIVGGTTTERSHFMAVNFLDDKVEEVSTSYMDGGGRQTMRGNQYKSFYIMGDALGDACSAHLSNEKRGKYTHVLSSIINSWNHSRDAFQYIDNYNRKNRKVLSVSSKNECDNIFVTLERASHELTEHQNSKNKPVVNINNTNKINNTNSIWLNN